MMSNAKARAKGGRESWLASWLALGGAAGCGRGRCEATSARQRRQKQKFEESEERHNHGATFPCVGGGSVCVCVFNP